jgi:hypothetical protein
MLDVICIALGFAIAAGFIRWCEIGLSIWFGDATRFDP